MPQSIKHTAQAASTRVENNEEIRKDTSGYSVSETDKTITTHIESSTFPNWIGTDQKRFFTLSGDELKWTSLTTSLGSGTALLVWKRAN
jgi:hypothetical protein